MFNLIRNLSKKRKIKAKIDQMKLKTEYNRLKLLKNSQIGKKNTSELNQAIMLVNKADELKQVVSETLPTNTIIQILNNPSVQELIRAGTMKFIGGKSISANDDDLISLYKTLPSDIKAKVKEFAIAYIGGGK